MDSPAIGAALILIRAGVRWFAPARASQRRPKFSFAKVLSLLTTSRLSTLGWSSKAWDRKSNARQSKIRLDSSCGQAGLQAREALIDFESYPVNQALDGFTLTDSFG